MGFSGKPSTYLRIAIIGSVLLNTYLYFGLAALGYLRNGETWVFGWKPALITVLFTAWFARTAYRWIMRLDAQYGSGKGWALESRKLKLPEPRRRP